MSNVNRNDRRSKVGVVVSNKMDKTIVIDVETVGKHPVYKKTIKKRKKFKAHDENNACQVGDFVEIMETRHLSKDKYFRLAKIIKKAK